MPVLNERPVSFSCGAANAAAVACSVGGVMAALVFSADISAVPLAAATPVVALAAVAAAVASGREIASVSGLSEPFAASAARDTRVAQLGELRAFAA